MLLDSRFFEIYIFWETELTTCDQIGINIKKSERKDFVSININSSNITRKTESSQDFNLSILQIYTL